MRGKPCWELGTPHSGGDNCTASKTHPTITPGRDYDQNFGELANILPLGKGFTGMGVSSKDEP